MPIIISGARPQGGGGVSQMDPYASTFLAGFGQGLNLGAVSVGRGADMAMQREQDAARKAEWDRQYGLQQKELSMRAGESDYRRKQYETEDAYRRKQDDTQRADDRAERAATAEALTPMLRSILGNRGGEYPGAPRPTGDVPNISGVRPNDQVQIAQMMQVQAIQQKKREALDAGFQQMYPSLLQTISLMPEGKEKAEMAAHAASLPQMYQYDPEGTADSTLKMLYSASGSVGEAAAFQQWSEDGMVQAARASGLNEGQVLALQIMSQTGAIRSMSEARRTIDEMQQALSMQGRGQPTPSPDSMAAAYPNYPRSQTDAWTDLRASGVPVPMPTPTPNNQELADAQDAAEIAKEDWKQASAMAQRASGTVISKEMQDKADAAKNRYVYLKKRARQIESGGRGIEQPDHGDRAVAAAEPPTAEQGREVHGELTKALGRKPTRAEWEAEMARRFGGAR